jgi:hypothetical protein
MPKFEKTLSNESSHTEINETRACLTQYYYSCGLSNYKAHPVGAPHSIPQKKRDEIKRSGKFILLGSSGLSNIVVACACTRSIEENMRQNFIPKLFIIDNSIYVQQFWFVMKEIVEKCQTFSDFENCVNTAMDKLKECCNPWFFDNRETIIPFVKKIIDNNKTDAPGSEGYVFLYIKNIILQSSIICDDMQSPYVFNYINQMNAEENLPICAFISNIIEFIATEQYNFLENIYKEYDCNKKFEKVKLIISNIASLQPEFVLHLRTSKQRSNELCLSNGKAPGKNVELNPDTLIVLTKEYCGIDDSLELLGDDKFTPIVTSKILDLTNINQENHLGIRRYS